MDMDESYSYSTTTLTSTSVSIPSKKHKNKQNHKNHDKVLVSTSSPVNSSTSVNNSNASSFEGNRFNPDVQTNGSLKQTVSGIYHLSTQTTTQLTKANQIVDQSDQPVYAVNKAFQMKNAGGKKLFDFSQLQLKSHHNNNKIK